MVVVCDAEASKTNVFSTLINTDKSINTYLCKNTDSALRSFFGLHSTDAVLWSLSSSMKTSLYVSVELFTCVFHIIHVRLHVIWIMFVGFPEDMGSPGSGAFQRNSHSQHRGLCSAPLWTLSGVTPHHGPSRISTSTWRVLRQTRNHLNARVCSNKN